MENCNGCLLSTCKGVCCKTTEEEAEKERHGGGVRQYKISSKGRRLLSRDGNKQEMKKTGRITVERGEKQREWWLMQRVKHGIAGVRT